MMSNELPRLLSIRAIAQTGIIPEHALRVLVKQNKIPHIKINSKVLINVNLLCDILNHPTPELCG
ncbi:MAG: hypothetical protein ACOYIO_08380 [Eubacteriales bacterium]